MNLVRAARDNAEALTRSAYAAAAQNGLLTANREIPCAVVQPKDASRGDWASSFALAAADVLAMSAHEIAACLLRHLDLTDSYFQTAAVAGPGYLNFTLGNRWYAAVLADIEREDKPCGDPPAVPQDSEHPLYRAIYAHARINTRLALRSEQGVHVPPAAETDVALLCAGHERDLMKTLAARPDPQTEDTRYLAVLAARFYAFYHATGLNGDPPALLAARLKLADCVRIVIAPLIKSCA